MKKKLISNIRYFLFLLLTILLSSEVLLHFYNPFVIRIKGDQIVLPQNRKYIYKNSYQNNIDSIITHTKNNFGFRGENPPSNFDSCLTIICVGGSTTECVYLTDGKDWPSLLSNNLKNDFVRIWVNNAGLDGHSTYGHLILMRDYITKIKPKIVLFLVGINDVGRKDINSYDTQYFKAKMPLYLRLLQKSELYNLFKNYQRKQKAIELKLAGNDIVNKSLHGDTSYNSGYVINPDVINATDSNLILNYEKRLKLLIKECKQYNIDPVFITQPLLLGNAIDSVSGLNFGNIKITSGVNGLQYWNILQKYNAATMKVAKDNKRFVINLADSMPKRREYFYDMMHFTNSGSSFVADLIYRNLKVYLKEKYPQFRSD